MPSFIFHLSDIYIFTLLSFFTVIVSVLAIFVISRRIPSELRYKDNSAIGNTSALISIIYGVLAGLISLYLMNNISDTVSTVQKEASAAANIYRDAKWLEEPERGNLRADVKKYIYQVIKVEWPIMKKGAAVPDDSRLILDDMDRQLYSFQENKTLDFLILHHLLDEIKALYDARELRISFSQHELSAEIWLVIFIGTILLIGINFLFGMNFYLHLIAVASIAIMTSSIIFLLVTLDRPFQGEFAVEPEAFQSVLRYIDNVEKN